ncbi:MAG: sigma-54 dependent transcriptional regulator [Planctomycetota bacterium]
MGHSDEFKAKLKRLGESLEKGGPERSGHTGGELWEQMGSSSTAREISSEVELVAPTDYSVIITGETGTGKELVARSLHRLSGRHDGPFVAVDCGSISPTLVESELFGHEEGAFTGAVRQHAGKFEAASGGTLFLDEIANLPPEFQPKLLRALQQRRVTRVGGSGSTEVDLRIVVATNRDLLAMVEAGEFRRDLYYRLNEFSIGLPPLRERRDDIAFLVNRFVQQSRDELGKEIEDVTEDALVRLLAYDWPGNVRELQNVIRRAALRCGSRITVGDLETPRGEPAASEPVEQWLTVELDGGISLTDLVRRVAGHVEKRVIERALRKADGNKAKVARMLDVDYKTIHTKVKRYGISLDP